MTYLKAFFASPWIQFGMIETILYVMAIFLTSQAHWLHLALESGGTPSEWWPGLPSWIKGWPGLSRESLILEILSLIVLRRVPHILVGVESSGLWR